MKNALRIASVGALSAVAAASQAAGAAPDFTTLTSAVDFSTTSTAIIAMAALIVVPYLAWKGGKLVLRMFKGG